MAAGAPPVDLSAARTRVVGAGGVGLVVFGATIAVTPWQVAALVSWDTAAAIVVAWVIAAVWRKNGEETEMLAVREDNSRAAADLLLLSAGVASLVGVGLVLVKAGHSHGSAKAAITAVGALSVVLSWAVVTTVFMLRYAHLYYSGDGGIDFNDPRAKPDYRDFCIRGGDDRHDLSDLRYRHHGPTDTPDGNSARAAVVSIRHRCRRGDDQRRGGAHPVALVRRRATRRRSVASAVPHADDAPPKNEGLTRFMP